MIGDDKIVKFEKWCPKCLYRDVDGYDFPCTECLDSPGNQDSHRPVLYKEDPSKVKKEKK